MKHLMLMFVFAIGLSAQVTTPPTRVEPTQLPNVAFPGVWMNLPGIGFSLVQLDLSKFVVDNTTTPPTLRLVTTAAIPQVNRDIITPPVNTSTVTITKASYVLSTLHVYKNGLLQYVGGDYTIAGTVVTFIIPTGTATDVIQLEYNF